MNGLSEKASTREKILDKAVEVFALKGYDAANLTDITEALGSTRSPIYYHFKDKYGLYRAAYELWEEDFSREMERIFRMEKPILEIYREILRFCLKSYARYAPNFFVGICTNPVLEEIQVRYYALEKQIFDREVELTRQAAERGELCGDINAELIVGLLFAINDGLRLGLERRGTGLKPGDIDRLISIQLKGIQTCCCGGEGD